jgi:methyl-accepting chemotaxis protein
MDLEKKAKGWSNRMMSRWLTEFTLWLQRRCFGGKTPSTALNTSTEALPEAPSPETAARDLERPRLSQKKADHLEADLGRCSAAMRQACEEVEKDFLAMGERLQVIYSQAVQLTQKIQVAVESIGCDSTDNILVNVTRTSRQALAGLEQEQDRIQECLKCVSAIGAQLLALHDKIAGLNGIAKTLKMVAVNINIESSRSAESHESYLVLAREIRSLSDTVADVARTLSNETKVVAADLGTMHQVMGKKLSHFQQVAQNAHAEVDRTAPEVQALIERAMQTLQHVSDDAQRLSRSTGEIVVNLQIHDNVSQRIEHIVHALADARRNLGQSGDNVHAIHLAHANLELQQAQLKSILEDIDTTYHQSTGAFGTIGRTVQEIAASLVGISSHGARVHGATQGGTGSMESLQSALEKIRQLISQGGRTVTELETIAQQATDAVARISGDMEKVQEVNFDIHLKALNAIFKSIHLGGQGRTIAVLVQEMKDLADHSNALVEQVDGMNRATIEAADMLQAQINGGNCADRQTVSGNHTDLNTGISEFSSAGAAFMENAGQAAQLNIHLTGEIHTIAKELSFLRRFADQLGDQLQQLEGVGAELAPWTDGGRGSITLDKEHLAARYTMQHERDIHATVLDPSEAADALPDQCPQQGGTMNPVDRETTQQDQHATESEALGDNVELF